MTTTWTGRGKGGENRYILTGIENSRQHGLSARISLATENLRDEARRDNIDEFADRTQRRR